PAASTPKNKHPPPPNKDNPKTPKMHQKKKLSTFHPNILRPPQKIKKKMKKKNFKQKLKKKNQFTFFHLQ
ncbi:hypothetical protein ACTHSD_11110, partial [Neisseria sp. P0004.S003]|uniref:hypothetical protein n=1 Tax=Neisseria sp. P0004.S003 TaxID=3436667 RepID=UPI003F7D43FC